MMQGIRRGLYSNEAGIGSAPNASASAQVSHPIKQGLVQMLSVFIDTLLFMHSNSHDVFVIRNRPQQKNYRGHHGYRQHCMNP